ncbi:MAG: hypothetical protein M1832_004924 [Thelocarpon impressellum]|nr:MAG: hypothetical protein M1832_004924 [Thelocarpon impressellum]
MAMTLPSYPYPSPRRGYWDPVTSTLNWCEEDYYATKYSAEIVNTLTNVFFMSLAFKGFLNCRKQQHDGIFAVAFVGYFLVGAGSFMFHTTLKYPMQLVDELSMIYTTCLMAYATFSYRKPSTFRVGLAVGLVSLAVFITLYYHYLQDPAFHQNAYAVMTAVVIFRSMYVMETRLRPSRRRGPRGDLSVGRAGPPLGHGQDARDEQILRTMWLMVGCGLSVFLGGVGIWTLDNKYCPTLRRWRRQMGLPWGILLEGHGWWHLMTGTGAYFYITWGIWLRHCLNGRQEEFDLEWPSLLCSLPEIVRKGPAAGETVDGLAGDGGTKKAR